MIEVRFSKNAEKWSLSKSEKPGCVPNKILLLGFCWDRVRLSCQHFVGHIWFWYAFNHPQPRVPTNPNISPTFFAFEVWLSGCLNFLHVSGHFCFLKVFPKGGSGSARIGLQELDRPWV